MAEKKNSADEQMPDKDEAIKIFEPALSPLFDTFREKINRLRQNPPQLLHIEGGSAELRTAFDRVVAKGVMLPQELLDTLVPGLLAGDCNAV